MIIKSILDYAIKNKQKIYLNLNQLLLIYIRGEKEVRKSRIIKIIEIDFVLLSRKNKLVISAFTNSTRNDINR